MNTSRNNVPYLTRGLHDVGRRMSRALVEMAHALDPIEPESCLVTDSIRRLDDG